MLATIAAYASGTQAATVGTEHFLSSPNAAGVYRMAVDASVLQAGDVLELRVYQIVLTGGTSRVVFFGSYAGVQPADDMIKETLPIGNELTDTNSLRFSLKQTFGTTRSFPWKVLVT